ncbi:Hypothetical protein FKW44_001249 [Caligus rogercresseyi]|uniref:Uncharacterized protein n=1 Tax=Caligus rogercresseyi TaxID=217165 RepID=A0A7T8KIH5_CALRO|nr:Hypothetical protein FKW44_001249 [Caligus rogercresseyi]
MTLLGASLDAKRRDHIHVHDLLERAGLPSSTRWPPRQWPWRPGNVFTPTTVAAVPGTRLVTSSSPSRGGP